MRAPQRAADSRLFMPIKPNGPLANAGSASDRAA